MKIPHVRLGATALCLWPINPYNSTMIVVTLIAKFTFSTIVFCSVLRIAPYLYCTEKFITQFKTTLKMVGHHTRFRENDDLPLNK